MNVSAEKSGDYMATIGAICIGGLSGFALALIGPWILVFLLSTTFFISWCSIGLYIGNSPALVLMQSFALASIVQTSYVLSGYFFDLNSPSASTRKMLNEKGQQ
jgi:hypothetical protein